jgi:DNA (cytosine-5)-methyltransferase 1
VNVLSLFSGYEGLGLGLRLAGLETRTVGYVEWDTYAQDLIQARIKDGYLDDAPIYGDISTFRGDEYRGVVDIITAGFPCPPFSTAGKRLGEADPRNMWPETRRVIGEVGPRFVLLENVPGILVPNNGGTGYAGTVVGQLSELGYVGRYGTLPAAAVGAPHLRWRWWCLAYSASSRCQT